VKSELTNGDKYTIDNTHTCTLNAKSWFTHSSFCKEERRQSNSPVPDRFLHAYLPWASASCPNMASPSVFLLMVSGQIETAEVNMTSAHNFSHLNEPFLLSASYLHAIWTFKYSDFLVICLASYVVMCRHVQSTVPLRWGVLFSVSHCLACWVLASIFEPLWKFGK
jgi:hypothetical protein